MSTKIKNCNENSWIYSTTVGCYYTKFRPIFCRTLLDQALSDICYNQNYKLSSAYPVGAVIGFDETQYTISEDGGGVLVTISLLQGTLSSPVEVTLMTVDGSASGKC